MGQKRRLQRHLRRCDQPYVVSEGDFDAEEWLQNTQDLGRLGLRALLWPADALASAREYERDSSFGNLINLILSGLPIVGLLGDIGKVASKLSETAGNLLRKIPGVDWLINKVDEFLSVPAAQRAWRESVKYTKQLNLPDAGVRPGKMHSSISVNEEGRAVIDAVGELSRLAKSTRIRVIFSPSPLQWGGGRGVGF